MLFSLKEFSYGYERADQVAGEFPAGAPILRFYMNSLYQYCANYYLVGGGNKLITILESMGSGDLLSEIRRLLGTQLGGLTLGEVLRLWRDKWLVHPNFKIKTVERHILAKFDPSLPDEGERLQALVNDLFAATQVLYVRLADRFSDTHR